MSEPTDIKEEHYLFCTHGARGRTERQIRETIRRMEVAAGQGVRTFKFFILDTKEVKELREFKKGAIKESRRLLNRVNGVTAYHRHGNEIPTGQLTELSNRQIEFENWIRSKADE